MESMAPSTRAPSRRRCAPPPPSLASTAARCAAAVTALLAIGVAASSPSSTAGKGAGASAAVGFGGRGKRPGWKRGGILLPRGALADVRAAADEASRAGAASFGEGPPGSSPTSLSSSSSSLLKAAAAASMSSTVATAPVASSSSLLRGGGAGGVAPAAASALSASTSSDPGPGKPVRVAFQGEAGAYSEKCLRELLGPDVVAVARPNFDSCYRAVASGECDYTLVPVENTLGGSIHENYDLMFRYALTVVAEHELRVSHCLLTKPGLARGDIKYAISHSQALAQCDNYLRSNGIAPVPTYDTAGSAKLIGMVARGEIGKAALPEGCTPENTAAIASDLAGKTYGLACREEGIEDDDSNFTRFLLLGREGVVQHLNKKIPCKTSLVFTLPESAGALYKSLACFSLRDIDMSKIESRPMSAGLLNYLRFRNTVTQIASPQSSSSRLDNPRFRYCFYVDILASEMEPRVQNALRHLREQSDYCRVLGSYPAKSRLVGPIADAVESLRTANAGRTAPRNPDDTFVTTLPSDDDRNVRRLKIGFVGYGAFGAYLSKKMSALHEVRCLDPLDKSKEAAENSVEYYPTFETSSFLKDLDVVVISVPMVELEETLELLPLDKLHGKLVVEVGPLNVHPREVLTRALGDNVDVLCTNPMFGPGSGSSRGGTSPSSDSWDGLPFVYEKARISDGRRAECFLSIFARERCQLVEMTSEDHDAFVADAEFVTHLTGRLLDRDLLPPTPVSSREYSALCEVADVTANDTFDLFYGMFRYNDRARELLNKMRDNLASVERKLAAKEAYLEASTEMKGRDRQKLLAECRSLLREVARSNPSVDARVDVPAVESSVDGGASKGKSP